MLLVWSGGRDRESSDLESPKSCEHNYEYLISRHLNDDVVLFKWPQNSFGKTGPLEGCQQSRASSSCVCL